MPNDPFDQASKTPDNPAIRLWNAMDAYREAIGVFHDEDMERIPKMTNSSPYNNGQTWMMNRYTVVGWGRHGLVMGVIGKDRINRRIYALGRPLSRGRGMSVMFVLAPDGRFMVPFHLTAHERWLLTQSTFLRCTYHHRELIWWASDDKGPSYRYEWFQRSHRQLVYFPNWLVSPRHNRGISPWLKLQPASVPESAYQWSMFIAWNQQAPGFAVENIDGEWDGHVFTRNDYLPMWEQYDEFRKRRYRRAENNFRRSRGQEVVSNRVPKMQADEKELVGDEAVTAITAAFKIDTEWRSQRWKREAEEATNEQLHDVESGHTAGT